MSVATHFTVSGCPQQFAQLSKQWLGFSPIVEQIQLPKVVQSSSPLPLEVRD
jgi:glutamate racemase